jgi:hypothetical protein
VFLAIFFVGLIVFLLPNDAPQPFWLPNDAPQPFWLPNDAPQPFWLLF